MSFESLKDGNHKFIYFYTLYNFVAFKIKYRFVDDEKFYTCYMTYEQHKNFKKLPILKECKVVKESKKNILVYKNEMQEALNLAAKNDTSHIRKLSECA